MRIGLARLAVLAACLLMATAASAQTYPARQIRLVVPFAAGGPADLLARVVADEMSKDFGQQVFVDNRPGANTIMGAELVAKADPDGYTLLMAIDGTLVMNPFLYSKLSYDPFKDFAPVTLVARVPSVLEANNSVTASTVQDIIAQEKAKPGTFLMGYSTPTSQVTGELFNMRAGIKIQLVPYRGGTTQVTGLLGGEISLGLESVNVALPFARADSRHQSDKARKNITARDYRSECRSSKQDSKDRARMPFVAVGRFDEIHSTITLATPV